MNSVTRRRFIRGTAVAGAATTVMAQTGNASEILKRPLGKSDLQVSALAMGGYHLGSAENQDAAREMVQHAIDCGINFFDNAWDYHNGQSESWLGYALAGRRKEVVLMTKVCTQGRDKTVAMQMLEESLRRLKTDYLDVWQIHEVIYENDPDFIFGSNGAAEALLQAKKEGKVRLIGFTGHKKPEIHLRMLSHGFPFDTVQMPLNAFDATFRSFEEQVLPEARKQGLAIFGMKSLGGSGEFVREGAITAAQALRYAMSLPVTTTISGMESMEVLKQNLAIAKGFWPLSGTEMAQIRNVCRPAAADGHLELFKTTTKYDGDIGRQQHGYPLVEELPA
ncbi:MAG: aldo/keto reductase [Acidobacteriaceae bacterium]|nr:aldo/keto reductase [Acidobacteriaceae bacterium]